MNDAPAIRALVADDEESIRFVLHETLEGLDYEVTEVENGDEALEQILSNQFQIAFLDIRMPGLSGLDILTHTSGAGIETAVIIITAQNTFDNAVEAMKRGAFDYLTKPFAVAEVEALKLKNW